MYHTRQAEQYGYSPTLQENRVTHGDWLPTSHYEDIGYATRNLTLFGAAAVAFPLVLVIRCLSKKDRSEESVLLGEKGRILLYLGTTYSLLLLLFVLSQLLRGETGSVIFIWIFFYPLMFAYKIATLPASILAVALFAGGVSGTLMLLIWLLLPLMNLGLLYGFFKWIRPSRD